MKKTKVMVLKICKERPVFGQNAVIRGCQEQEVPQLPLQT